MTASEIEQLASERIVSVPEVHAACEPSGQNLGKFLDHLALSIARRFLVGSASFQYCDAVMNGLHDAMLLATPGRVSSKIAWTVFLAFDAGEFHHPSDPSSIDPVEKYTRLQLIQILREYENQSG